MREWGEFAVSFGHAKTKGHSASWEGALPRELPPGTLSPGGWTTTGGSAPRTPFLVALRARDGI